MLVNPGETLIPNDRHQYLMFAVTCSPSINAGTILSIRFQSPSMIAGVMIVCALSPCKPQENKELMSRCIQCMYEAGAPRFGAHM